MTKTIVTPLLAAIAVAVFTCAANAQYGGCSTGYPTYDQFCQTSCANPCQKPGIFNDKMVRPFNHCMSTCANPCGGSCCGFPRFGHGCIDRLLGRNVNCAGPDFGYTYTPGYGANGQGLAPGWGMSQSSGMQPGYPSYIYRSPRDFLNPNPPSIGY